MSRKSTMGSKIIAGTGVETEQKDVVKIISKSDDKLKFQCMLCKEETPHMIVIMSKDGDIHVHAPFENKYMMNQFMEAVIDEQNKFNKK